MAEEEDTDDVLLTYDRPEMANKVTLRRRSSTGMWEVCSPGRSSGENVERSPKTVAVGSDSQSHTDSGDSRCSSKRTDAHYSEVAKLNNSKSHMESIKHKRHSARLADKVANPSSNSETSSSPADKVTRLISSPPGKHTKAACSPSDNSIKPVSSPPGKHTKAACSPSDNSIKPVSSPPGKHTKAACSPADNSIKSVSSPPTKPVSSPPDRVSKPECTALTIDVSKVIKLEPRVSIGMKSVSEYLNSTSKQEHKSNSVAVTASSPSSADESTVQSNDVNHLFSVIGPKDTQSTGLSAPKASPPELRDSLTRVDSDCVSQTFSDEILSCENSLKTQHSTTKVLTSQSSSDVSHDNHVQSSVTKSHSEDNISSRTRKRTSSLSQSPITLGGEKSPTNHKYPTRHKLTGHT